MGKPYLADTIGYTVSPAKGTTKRVRRRSIGTRRYYVKYRWGYIVYLHASWYSGPRWWRPTRALAERKGSWEALREENERQEAWDLRHGNLNTTFAPGART